LRKIIVLLGCLILLSFRWPAPIKNMVVSFLQTNEQGASPGVRFLTVVPEIAAVQQGEIIFFTQPQRDWRKNWFANGQYLMTEHPDGFRSLLMGVRLQESLRHKQRLLAGERVGEVLDPDQGIFLVIFSGMGQILNPLNYFPEINQDWTPNLVSLIFQDDQGRDFTITQQSFLPVGFYKARMVVVEREQISSNRVVRRPLRSWALEIDSTDLKEWELNNVAWTQTGPLINGQHRLQDWVAENQVYQLGEVFVKVGLNTYSISAKGFTGRFTRQLYRVVGRRP